MNYDHDFFLRKFSAIPDEQWCTCARTNYLGQHCAIGHTERNRHETKETAALNVALLPIRGTKSIMLHEAGWTVANINNGDDARYQQSTPKARILAALRDAKAIAETALDRYETRPLVSVTKMEVA